MAWRSSGMIGRGGDEPAATQVCQGRVHGAFGKPGDIRDRAHTGTDGAPLGSCGRGVKVEINEIR